jgi:hypothetical protein
VVPSHVLRKTQHFRGIEEVGTTGTSGTSEIESDLALADAALDGDVMVLFEERAAIIEEGAGVPRTWAEGFARLSLAHRPKGFSAEQ